MDLILEFPLMTDRRLYYGDADLCDDQFWQLGQVVLSNMLRVTGHAIYFHFKEDETWQQY